MGAKFNRQDVSLGAIPVGMCLTDTTTTPAACGLPNHAIDWGVLPSGASGNVLTVNADGSIGWGAAGGLGAIAASSLLGNPTGSSAVPEAITLGTGLSFSGTTLVSSGGSGTPGGTSGQVQYDNAGSFGGFTMSGDATLVTSTGVITVGAGKITYAKMQNTSAGSVLLGNPTGSAAAPSEITLGANLSFSGTTLVASTGGAANPGGTANQIQYNSGGTAFGGFTMSGDATLAVSTGVITVAAGAITLAKQANLAASSLMGNPTGSSAAPSAITLGANLSFSGTTLVAAAGLTNPMTTAGDTIYGGASGTPTRLAIGTASQALMGGASAPAWANPLTIGNPVIGGGTGRLLYEDSSGNLATSSYLTCTQYAISQTSGIFSAQGITCSGTMQANLVTPYNSSNLQLRPYNATNSVALTGLASQTAPLLGIQQLDSTSVLQNCGIIDAQFNSSTHASWTGNLLLYAGDYTSSNAGKRLGLEIQSNGSAALLGYYGATPVIQPTGGGGNTSMTANTGTAVLAGSTFTGASGSSTYTIGDIVTALKALGLLTP